jgi:nucleoside diphosphate-linked moiety X motif protein 19
VLTFKRTEKTSFYANSLAFPGGSLDKSDESLSWVNFFKHHKLPSEQLRRNPMAKKPFIYDPQNNKLEREISLRLAAIRETFEELGIVLCCKPDEVPKSVFSTYHHAKDFDIPLWQNKIHDHHETLMSFCDKHSLVPNIFNLYEWSVWLTPTFYPKRFETAFFIVTLNNIPPCYSESHEVQDYSVGNRYALVWQGVNNFECPISVAHS